MKQPKALRLSGTAWIARGKDWHVEADAELRRLHEVNHELLGALCRATCAMAFAAESSDAMLDDSKAVDAAIAKATGCQS
jgi:hypothetical protein